MFIVENKKVCFINISSVQFRLFVIPRAAARPASLSITNSHSLQILNCVQLDVHN